MIRAATLFSGIGAPEVAMPHWQWMWHAEIERFPAAVMAARHGNENLGDVSAASFITRAGEHPRPDVTVFGSPCQDFSVAGLRAGMDGDRGNLAGIAVEVAACIGTRWLVFENVPGMLSSFSGASDAEDQVRKGGVGGWAEADEQRDFAAFLRALRERGYLGCWRVFDAQYSGVPQRRRRVFFVGYLGDWRPSVSVLFEPQSLHRNHPPSREAGKRVAPTVEARAGAGGAAWGTDFLAGGGLAAASEISGAVSRKWSKGTGGPAGDECYNLVGFSCKDDGQGSATNLSPTLRAMDFDGSHANGGGQMAVAFQRRIARNGRGQPEEVVPALNGADAGATSDMRPCIATDSFVRRLTPRECERLQGLPDDYTLIKYRGKLAADGPRYMAIGNSMAVPDIRWILQRIERFERWRATCAA